MNELIKYIGIRIALLIALVCTILLIFSDDSNADSYVSAMAGVFNSGKSSLSETKLINFGYRNELGFGFSYQFEGGGWADRVGQGRSSSGYVATQLGVQAGDSLISRLMIGPAIITSPDDYLGGYFQFTEDFFVGITGKSGNTVGVKYKHFSSAGIEMPNVGRDFFGFEASIPF